MKIKALNEPDLSDVTSDESTSDDNNQQSIGKEKLEDSCFEKYQKALIAIRENQQDLGQELLEDLDDDLEDIESDNETLRQLKFSVLKNLGNLVTEGIDHYVKALEIDPSDIILWIKTGDRCVKIKSYSVARNCYEKALDLNPSNWIAIDKLIELYYILHLPFELFDICSKALELNKDYVKARVLLEEARGLLPNFQIDTIEIALSPHDKSVVEKLDSVKRKRRADTQDELLRFKRARLSINLDTTRTQSLSSFGNYIIKIYERFAKQFITRNTMIDIAINNISTFTQHIKNGSINSQSNNPNSNEPQNTCSQDIEMSNEGEVASNSENDKIDKDRQDLMISSDENEQTKSNSRIRQNTIQKNSSLSFAAMLFPMDMNDKRRSSRNRNNNQFDTFSFKLKFDELNDLLPECLRIGAIEQALQKRKEEQQSSIVGKSEDTQEEPVLIETNLDPVREDLIIKDVIELISGQAQPTGTTISNIKLSEMFYVYLSKLSAKKQNTLPEAFSKIYRFYRKLCPLPTGVFIEIGENGVKLEELWFTLTANEISYQHKECLFLLRILEQLAMYLDETQHKEFIVRLFLVLGLNSDYRYLEVALQNIEEDARVYASNRKIITRAHIKTLIDKKTEKMQQDDLYDEDLDDSLDIVDRLGPKSENEMSDREVQLLCNAIKSAKLWQRGLDTLNQRNDLNSDIIIETMNLCLKNGAKMDAILASKLCKEAVSGSRPTTWSCLYRGWLGVLSPSELSSEKTISDIDKFFDIGHQTLGKKNACTADKGEFLMLHVKHLLDDEREVDDRELFNSFYCLFGYPSKRPTSVAGHKAVKVSMVWEYAETVYSYFELEEQPTYMSLLRKVGISSEVEPILMEIAKCVPAEFDPKSQVKLVEDFIELGKPFIQPDLSKNSVTENLFYFLADYYFKNKEFDVAREFYNYDLVINPTRFDSWAASGLLRASRIDKALSEGFVTTDEFTDGWLAHIADSAIRCFDRATMLRPNEPKATLWIEFGNLTYNLTSLASRLFIYDDLECDVEGKNPEPSRKLVERHKHLYDLAKKCFVSANRLCACDEVWLHYYMLGKIYEKQDTLKALKFYSEAEAELFHEGACYPKKISYHNPPDLAYEAMEVHYRTHAAVLKYLLNSDDIFMDHHLLEIKRYLLNAQRSPFVELEGYQEPKKAMIDHLDRDVSLLLDDIINLVTEETNPEQLMFMCLHGMKRCLIRCDKNFKALYRLSYYYWAMKNPQMAQDILMSREIQTDRRIANLTGLRQDLPDFTTMPPDLRGVDSLFKDRKQGNLFANIWRMPIEEIDRPGCFEHWMFKSVWLLIKISTELKDANTLSLVSFQLSREPEVSKKYLHNRPRILLSSFAIDSLVQVINYVVEKARNTEQRQQLIRDSLIIADRFIKANLHTDKIRDLYNQLQGQVIQV